MVKTDNDTLLKVLLGLEPDSASMMNTRKIKFLSVKEGKKKGASGGMNGLIYNPSGTSVTGLFDPWGGVYNVMMDGDYDETLKGVKPKGSTTSLTLSGRRVAAWSDGADGASTGNGAAADDVVTWNK